MIHKMVARLWGALAALLGLLSIMPSFPVFPRRGLALLQLAATENPGLAMVSGGIGVVQGLRRRAWSAVLLGAAGVGLGVRPLIRRGAVNVAMSGAMRDGLGIGWQSAIPQAAHQRFGQTHRTDLWGPLLTLLRARVKVAHDVVFAAPEGHPLRVDIYEPHEPHEPDKADGRHPAVVVVHGGTWFQGDKSSYAFGLHDRWLAAQGYVVFDVQYRLGAEWPAPLSDVKCAIRWVRANAERYAIDPDRVALMGRSAGAHLALMAAYTAGDPDLPPGCTYDRDGDVDRDDVAAVVVAYAPTDLRLWPADRASAIAHLLGGLPDEIPDVYAQASPVTHVRPGLPPTLIIQGQRDRLVPPAHAELLSNLLRAAGVTNVLLRIPWGRHGVDSLLVGLTGPMIQYDVDRFLAWVFHRAAPDQPPA